MQEAATRCKEAADEGDWVRSTQLWYATELIVWQLTNFIDFYNILKYVNVDFGAFERSAANKNLTTEAYEAEKLEYLRKIMRTTEQSCDKTLTWLCTWTFLCSSTVRKFHLHTSPEVYDDLDDLMNNEIREKLGIIPNDVIWGGGV